MAVRTLTWVKQPRRRDWQTDEQLRMARSRVRMAKVESLYGTTPAEIFESGLENVGHCGGRRNLWRVGRVTAGWSSVDPASLARMVLMLDQEQRRKTLRPLTDQI